MAYQQIIRVKNGDIEQIQVALDELCGKGKYDIEPKAADRWIITSSKILSELDIKKALSKATMDPDKDSAGSEQPPVDADPEQRLDRRFSIPRALQRTATGILERISSWRKQDKDKV